MGFIIGHGIDYNGVGALRGQRHISSKIDPSTPLLRGNTNAEIVMCVDKEKDRHHVISKAYSVCYKHGSTLKRKEGVYMS